MPLVNIEQDTPEWLALREGKIGMSDVGTIMGLNPYKSARRLWMEKKGLVPRPPMNDAMRRGKELEPHLREIFEQASGRKFPPKVFIHPEMDFLMASLDGYAEGTEFFSACTAEFKVVGPNSQALKMARENIVMPMYFAQMQGQIDCAEVDFGHFCIWDGAGEKHMIGVERDDMFIESLLEQAEEFWNSLNSNEIPPRMDGVEINSSEWEDLEVRYYLAKEEEERVQAELSEIKEGFKMLAGDQKVYGSRYYATTQTRAGTIDTKAMAQDGIDIEKYRKSESNYFVIKEMKYGN